MYDMVLVLDVIVYLVLCGFSLGKFSFEWEVVWRCKAVNLVFVSFSFVCSVLTSLISWVILSLSTIYERE